MDKELRTAFLEKEKLELFLANLERLHNETSINDSSYNTLKGEYTANLKKSVAQIGQLKQEVDKKLQVRSRELGVYKQELANLEARFKVGQVSADFFLKTAKIPEKKVASLESVVAHLTSLLNATDSSEITVMEESGFASIFSLKGRQAIPAAVSVNFIPPAVPAQLPEPVPPPVPEVVMSDTTVISSLVILPDRVMPGSTIGVIATIINTGHEVIQHRAEFKINHKLESVSDIMLDPGQSSELTFMTIGGAPGDYTVSVDAADGLLKVVPLSSSNVA